MCVPESALQDLSGSLREAGGITEKEVRMEAKYIEVGDVSMSQKPTVHH